MYKPKCKVWDIFNLNRVIVTQTFFFMHFEYPFYNKVLFMFYMSVLPLGKCNQVYL